MKLSFVSASPLLLALLASTATVACQSEGEDTESGAGAVVQNGKPVLSSDPSKLMNVPFYFGVPKAAIADSVVLNRNGYSYPTLYNPSTELDSTGLRIIAINQKLPRVQEAFNPPDNAKMVKIASANAPAKVAARNDMSKQLAAAGVLQDGDVVLSFRPENASTIPYMHVQMGATHASLTYLSNGVAKNVDAPMNDNEYVGAFNTLHFVGGISPAAGSSPDYGTDALHIMRPRALAESKARRDNLNLWATKAAANRANGHVSFNSDYLQPSAPTTAEARKLATELGKAILGMPAANLKIFCSEFAWHMLALSNCSETDIRNSGPTGAQCAEDGIVFAQMPLIGGAANPGLGEGPLVSVLGAPAAQQPALITQLFTSMDALKMSSGHKATAAATAPLMGPLSWDYLKAAGLGSTIQEPDPNDPKQMVDVPAAKVDFVITTANSHVKPNYSPTAFIAEATKPRGSRAVDYVATVVFVDTDADFDKAKDLAKNPVP